MNKTDCINTIFITAKDNIDDCATEVLDVAEVESVFTLESLEEEIDSVDVSIAERTIHTDKSDPEVDSLHGKSKRGKLAIQPDFQRHFVWDKPKSSRLIESALLKMRQSFFLWMM